MLRITLIISLSICFFSCENKSNNKSVSGNLTNLDLGTELFLDYLTPDKIYAIDTTTIKENGSFAFQANIDKTGYYRLRINNQSFLNLVLEKGDSPSIIGDGKNLIEGSRIEGSEESIRLTAFQLAFSENKVFLDSLLLTFQTSPNDPGLVQKLQKSEGESITRMNTKIIKIINDKPGSLVSLAAVQQLNSEKYNEVYRRVNAALNKKLPENKWVIAFNATVQSMDKLAIGEPIPNITLNNTQGNPISLTSLKGKVVLIDFWASWCRPCRMENPNVVKAYNTYKDKGFEVFSVSLDGVPQQKTAKQDWINAIKADGLVWENHVSDLQGWNSSVVPLFELKGIPFTLLIDQEGKILGKNLRGDALENKLASIFR
jgi:thiol-disulfide isomerase/thioredoxin